MIWPIEVGGYWLIKLSRRDVGAVAVHSDVQRVLRLPDILQTTPLALYHVHHVFSLACKCCSHSVCSSCGVTCERKAFFDVLASLTSSAVAGCVSRGSGWGCILQLRADQKISQVSRAAEGNQGRFWYGSLQPV